MPNFPSNVEIHFLTEANAPAYQALRLESLKTNANAFLSLYETESQLKQSLFANHLRTALRPPFFGFLGVFVEGKLVGYIQIGDTYFEKQQHIATLYNLYISPTYRHKGLAHILFEFVFEFLKTAQFERIFLSYTGSNKEAQRLYKQLGFQRIGIKKQAIKWQGVYDDEIEMVKVL